MIPSLILAGSMIRITPMGNRSFPARISAPA
jgi:hypothetical protein